MQNNRELELAWEFINYTKQNIFLTGKAGTGKTTFLKRLKDSSFKRMAVVAPTGVAAINAGGVTIHSFFQLPFGPILPNADQGNNPKGPFNQRFTREKIDIIRSLDLLVIDEISMVRADLLDGIDKVLRRYRNRTFPFGGVQLLLIGDLQQLPPVVKNEEQHLLSQYYQSLFFFGSHAYQSAQVKCIELKKVYRQSDETFINILNEVRENRLSPTSINTLNQRYKENFSPSENDGYIHLTTHNSAADRINAGEMDKLSSRIEKFEAEVAGNFPESAYPTQCQLQLKKGAQVMFIKNDSSFSKLYYNGKIGTITHIDDDEVTVKCPGDYSPITVERTLWNNIKYELNEKTKEMEEKIEGSFLQFPLRLAWAITIHKSQGLTFEHAIIDAQSAFAHGQTYVALSRCKTLEGMVLSSPLSEKAVISDGQVNRFNQQAEANQPNEEHLQDARKGYQMSLLQELFNFKPLEYQIKKAIEDVQGNGNALVGNISETLSKVFDFCTKELIGVGDKFIRQLHNLSLNNVDVENSTELQERITKAAVYFSGIIATSWDEPLKEMNFETDNHALEKDLNKRLNTITGMMSVKTACLEKCKEGFKLQEFIAIRAKALLQETETKKKSKKSKTPVDSLHPELHQTLTKWRWNMAEEHNLRAYQILTQKALLAIVEKLPTNSKDLLKISGVGTKTVSKFGPKILEMVSEYAIDKGLKIEVQTQLLEEPTKVSTFAQTLALIKEGKTLEEIAEQRGLSTSTIESHVVKNIELGELDITDWMDTNKMATIQEHFQNNPMQGLKDAKEALGEEISYADLHMVRAWMKRQE